MPLHPVANCVCTIALAWQVFADAPVTLAANRDELYDRPAEPPKLRDWERPVIAPKDRKAAGTWLGSNNAGLFVIISNRWDGRTVPDARSRGLLVRDALAHEDAESAVRFVERELDTNAYEGFHLLAVDRTAALLVEFDGTRRIRPLEPGIQIIVNVGTNGQYVVPAQRETAGKQQAQNADRIHEELQPEPGERGEQWLERASDVLADHEFGVCIHGDGFGTRSAVRLRLTPDDVVFEFADGPPCETGFEPVSVSF